jgi:hypothetical protein
MMAALVNKDWIRARSLLDRGWVHHFIPLSNLISPRVGWLVDTYGPPANVDRPVHMGFDFDNCSWMFVRMEEVFKSKLDFKHDWLFLFESEEMLMMYKLRFGE